MVAETFDVAIIGAGQAGLAVSHHLTRRSIDHVVLERSRPAATWRRRWDSFTLVIPNWACRLPGFEYEGDRPEGFMARDEVVDFFDRYVASFDPPLRLGVEAKAIEREAADAYRVETGDGEVRARNVVVATGAFPVPSIPRVAAAIPDDVVQIHSDAYRRPDALPAGGVLMAGAGQSGVQIAEELLEAGRDVWIAAGRCGWGPRRYRGRDTGTWMAEMGVLDRPVDMLESPADRLGCNLQVTGKNGGHDLNLRLLAERGARVMGRLEGVGDHVATLGGGVAEMLAEADREALQLAAMIDQYIEKAGVAAPPPEDTPGMAAARAPRDPEPISELDLGTEGIGSVLWATGYRLDFGWIHLDPLMDAWGFPIHRRGVSNHPGLYFTGLPWLHTPKSSLIYGTREDSKHIAGHVADRLAG